ncbi:chemosensory receptor c [Plakobranchus ocellatus]|uniref:Chemosensory receptor c n=1 Tax=Plakobranchus ocellatus TaxID=259542 RepID=A0AAV4A7P2_9GAST|nr:chemosensory receptor c [Plakobranchus ocellatus]
MDQITTSFINLTLTEDDIAWSSVPFLDTAQADLLRRSLYYFVNMAFRAVSVITNTLNIVTFIKAGLSEGISCLFLGLSVSDLLLCTNVLTARTLDTAEIFFNQHPYHVLKMIAFFFARLGGIWQATSTLLTVFAAIQKCACVTFPLTFRFFFTQRRTVIVIFIIYVCVIISYIPQYIVDSAGPYFSTRFNRTRISYMIRYPKLYKESADYYLFAHYVCLPFIALSINILCVVVLTWNLKEAARMRKDMTSQDASSTVEASKSSCNKISNDSNHTDKNKKTIDNSDDKESNRCDKSDNCSGDEEEISGSKKSNILSDRELRVLRSVNLVCVIFIRGTAPYCILNSCALFLDSFDHRGRHFTLYYILVSTQEIWYFGSTSVNIFVYYIYNTKYKKTFNRLFSPLLPNKK